MNRNVESHFYDLPAAEIERATFDRSSGCKTSFNAGDLIPFFVDEVLPGDTFDVTTTKVIRSHTLLTPLMDNLYCDVFYFYVPNRLVWNHWKEFCGENSEGPWASQREYFIPKVSAPDGGFVSGTIADYFGLPVGVDWNNTDEFAPSALPFRAYGLICNEFFRDQNVCDPLFVPLDDANQVGSNGDDYVNDVVNGGKPYRAARMHDFFSSVLPSPQKGDPVGIPIDIPGFSGGVFPVTTTNQLINNIKAGESFYPLIQKRSYQTSSQNVVDNESVNPVVFGESGNINRYSAVTTAQNTVQMSSSDVVDSSYYALTPFLNQVVNIPVQDGSNSIQFTVNDLRLAFAYQRFLEALARSGSRYTEVLLGIFGVSAPDASLQRPEYLGGNRVPLNVSEVTNTAQTSSDYLGDLGAKSQTGDINHSFTKSFTEHGYVIGLMCVRYDHTYSQGIQKFWTRSKFTDFYNPKFAHLGEMPVYTAEIYADGYMNNKDSVFGYQEAFADYRFKPSICSGEMRPGVDNSLAHWNLADYYESAPTLSQEWMLESPVNVDRVLAVSHTVADQFWADILIANKCTRPMPLYSVPGLLDHF